ncbi:MAG: site-2 protease family protein [Candidatus Marinimicrobia bacterium]|nr:site-2 protease family protein [Candidatus Neomarinimicrobiota bacterium]
MLTRGIPLEQIIILIPVLLFSLCFHEFSHAYAAYRLGDNTSKRLGRLNLSPLSHLDPWGTLMLLFVGFGWAKPVPVNPFNLKNPKKDLMIIAAAGPLSNLFLAFIASMILRFINHSFIKSNNEVFFIFIFINITLAIFNLIPIRPLDGSQILSGFLPQNNNIVKIIEQYGPNILIGLIIFGIITNIPIIFTIMSPFINFFIYLFLGINV